MAEFYDQIKDMKSVNSEELINSLEDQVSKHLDQAIMVYQNLSEAQLNKQAADGGWSIAQCLDHLNAYGDYYLPQMEKRMASSNLPSSLTFTSSWLGNYFTDMLDPDKGKRKMKAFKDYRPAVALDGHAVVAKFIQQQETFIRLLRKAHYNNINKIWIPISISRFIKMKLGDTFRFLIAHNERHVRQANRIEIKTTVQA